MNHPADQADDLQITKPKSKAPLVIGLLVAVAAAAGIFLATRPQSDSQRNEQSPVTTAPIPQSQTGAANHVLGSGVTAGSQSGEMPTMSGSASLLPDLSLGIGKGSDDGSKTIGSAVDGKTVVETVGDNQKPALPSNPTSSKITGKISGKTAGKTLHGGKVKVVVKPEVRPEVRPESKPPKICDAFSTADGCKSTPK